MAKLILETARGTRDFPPSEKIIRDKVINQIKEIFEIYGFSPLETPTFEKLEILEAKFGAGENSDAISEIYRFKDQGNRDLGLRYEFTFALARFVGQNPQLKLPFKRYQIGTVFRDGPIKAGRYREFYQCDIDVVGVKSVLADAEALAVVKDVFNKLKLDVIIEVNDRKLLTEIIKYSGIEENQATQVIISIDKLKKIGINGVKAELLEKQIPKDKIEKLMNLLTEIEKGTNTEKLKSLKNILGETEGLKEIEELLGYLKDFSVDVEFSPSLARGLGYYTGPIFEVFLKDQTIMSSSIAGGGRWDKMIGKYIGNEKMNYPATGLSFGIEPIMDIILKRDGTERQTVTDLFVIPINYVAKAINIGTEPQEFKEMRNKLNLTGRDSSQIRKQAIKITQELRKRGLKAQVDLLDRSVSKNIEYADKLGIPYVGFLGEDEIKQNKIKIRNLKTGKEELIDVDKVNL
ncbi:MAG TPA: histidine--tRNA ligase [Candidatus Diapherotrites archaeon]|nr:histidine--tRNA ligase [Candidatus Diapherotrites archaeon]